MALMVALPLLTDVTKPVALTVATSGLADSQVTPSSAWSPTLADN